jgi:hypothetical protein
MQTDIDFPADLPCPLREDYDLSHVSPFTRTAMESGRARQRRKFTSVPSNVRVSWQFNDSQAAAFELWFQQTIHDGADWFNAMLKTPIGYEPYVCRFTEMYRGPVLSGRGWRVTASLEIWQRPLLPADWLLLPDYITGSDIFDRAMNREWPEA